MAYVRHTWTCDEDITDDALNNIEDGIEEALECCGGGSDDSLFIIHNVGDTGVALDKTFAEMLQATYARKALIATVNGIFYTYGGTDYGQGGAQSIYFNAISASGSDTQLKIYVMTVNADNTINFQTKSANLV